MISAFGQDGSSAMKLNLFPVVYEDKYFQITGEFGLSENMSGQFSFYYNTQFSGLSPEFRYYIDEAISGFYVGGMATWLREGKVGRRSVTSTTVGGGVETGWNHFFGKRKGCC